MRFTKRFAQLALVMVCIEFLSLDSYGKENHLSYIQCYHSIYENASTIDGLNLAVSCSSKKRVCYLLGPNTAKVFSIPEKKSYTKKEVKVPETDILQDIDVYQIAWGPAPNEKIHLNYYRQVKDFFVKAPDKSLEDSQYIRVQPTEGDEEEAISHFRSVLLANLVLLDDNFKIESWPEGWSVEQYKRNTKVRLSACSRFIEDKEIGPLLRDLIARVN